MCSLTEERNFVSRGRFAPALTRFADEERSAVKDAAKQYTSILLTPSCIECYPEDGSDKKLTATA